jgi:toxin ParE1/3/4
MQLRWSQEAVKDLERITDYLFEESPQDAAEQARAVYDAPNKLVKFPYRGRPGRRTGTRELVLSPLPYIVVYRVAYDAVIVVRILHGSQNWP